MAEVPPNDKHVFSALIKDNLDSEVYISGRTKDEALAIASRIHACVNAFQGIEDPTGYSVLEMEAEIRRLKQAVVKKDLYIFSLLDKLGDNETPQP